MKSLNAVAFVCLSKEAKCLSHAVTSSDTSCHISSNYKRNTIWGNTLTILRQNREHLYDTIFDCVVSAWFLFVKDQIIIIKKSCDNRLQDYNITLLLALLLAVLLALRENKGVVCDTEEPQLSNNSYLLWILSFFQKCFFDRIQYFWVLSNESIVHRKCV